MSSNKSNRSRPAAAGTNVNAPTPADPGVAAAEIVPSDTAAVNPVVVELLGDDPRLAPAADLQAQRRPEPQAQPRRPKSTGTYSLRLLTVKNSETGAERKLGVPMSISPTEWPIAEYEDVVKIEEKTYATERERNVALKAWGVRSKDALAKNDFQHDAPV